MPAFAYRLDGPSQLPLPITIFPNGGGSLRYTLPAMLRCAGGGVDRAVPPHGALARDHRRVLRRVVGLAVDRPGGGARTGDRRAGGGGGEHGHQHDDRGRRPGSGSVSWAPRLRPVPLRVRKCRERVNDSSPFDVGCARAACKQGAPAVSLRIDDRRAVLPPGCRSIRRARDRRGSARRSGRPRATRDRRRPHSFVPARVRARRQVGRVADARRRRAASRVTSSSRRRSRSSRRRCGS